MNNLDVLGLTRDDKESTRPTAPLRQGGVPYAPDPIEENGSPWSSHRMYPATPETTCDGRMRGVPGLTMPDVAVIIALVLSSGSLVVSIASFVLAISAKRQAKKAATLGFRVEAINHLRAVLSDIDRGSITSRTVDTIHDAMRSTELVFTRDVRERLHRASAAIFRLNMPAARGKAHYPQDIIRLRDELQTLLTQMRQEPHAPPVRSRKKSAA